MAYPPELRERAQELRIQGLLQREIAAELGVPQPTVARWLNPELEARERVKARERKFTTGKSCPTCGERMTNTATRCRRCYITSQRYWTREKIITAVRSWAAKRGRAPVHDDWMRAGKDHPAIRSIVDGPNPPFKTWSEVLEAAGFEPRKRRSERWEQEKLSRQRRAELRRQIREDALKRALAREDNGDL